MPKNWIKQEIEELEALIWDIRKKKYQDQVEAKHEISLSELLPPVEVGASWVIQSNLCKLTKLTSVSHAFFMS